MPCSLDQVLLHVVFSTKNRCPCIGNAVRPILHAQLASTVRKRGCDCPRVGGMADHVHLAIGFSPTITIAALVEELKASSCQWLKSQAPEFGTFAWQRGYGVFSVGASDRNALLAYIDLQEQHHQTSSYQDEYRAFLRKYGVRYSERHVWD